MAKIEISKTDIHASRPWQVFAFHADRAQPIPCGSFKTKRAALAEAVRLGA